MSFRRSSSNAPHSSRWRAANCGLLLECGIPAEVASNDRRWVYVMLHGCDELGTGWNVDWISPAQARLLLNRLTQDMKSEIGYDLLRILRRRCSESDAETARVTEPVARPDISTDCTLRSDET